MLPTSSTYTAVIEFVFYLLHSLEGGGGGGSEIIDPPFPPRVDHWVSLILLADLFGSLRSWRSCWRAK